MRVLHLSSERSWRGGEQQIAYLIEESSRLGVETFIACRRGSAFEKYCEEQKIQHVALPFFSEFDLYTSFEIKSLCKKLNVDLLHIHSSHSHGLAVWAHLLGNNTDMILHRRVDFPVKNNFLSRYKYNYPAIKKIICVSDKIKAIVSQSLLKPEKCVTIYSGIDLTKFRYSRGNKLKTEFGIPAGTKLIANVSAIAPHKDYRTFVDTAEAVTKKRQDVIFLIIGDGPCREEISAYIKSKNLECKVVLTGFRTDIPEILPELDIFLITSKTEGLGTTILDAFACNVPVVATAGGGIPELIKDGETGFLAPVGKAAILAEKIFNVLENENLRDLIVSNARKKVTEFSKEHTAQQTIHVYKELLAKKIPD